MKLSILASLLTAPAAPPGWTPPHELSPPVGSPVGNVLGEAATQNFTFGTGLGETAGLCVITRHRVVCDVASGTGRLRWVITSGYVSASDPGAMRVAVRRDTDNVLIELTFGGVRGALVPRTPPTGAYHEILSDPIPLDLYSGQDLIVYGWGYRTSATGNTMKGSLTGFISGWDVGVTSGTWQSAIVTNPATGGQGQLTLRPAALLAPSDQPSWLILGDSIMQGGWAHGEIAIHDKGMACVKAAQGGDNWSPMTGGSYGGLVTPNVPFARRVIDFYGINSGSNTLQVVAERAVSTWRRLRADGAEVIIRPTLLPVASSTDGYATAENQTASRTYRVPLNNWFRDGAPMLADFTVLDPGTADSAAIRCAVVRDDGSVTPASGPSAHLLTAVSNCGAYAGVESSLNSGTYTAGIGVGSDGLHPALPVHRLVASRLRRDLDILGL